MTKKVNLTITITEQYQLQCLYSNEENGDRVIKIHENQEIYPFTICLKNNKIIVGEKHEDSIEFIQDLFSKPQDFKLYDIKLYGKEYSVIAEVLFALIINEFKGQIEKEFIIENITVKLPVQNLKVNSRILTALDSINLRNIQLEEEEIDFEYKSQGEILHKIIRKHEELCKRKRMIEKE